MPDDRMENGSTRKTLQIDVAKYQAMLEAPGLDDGQKRQFIEALWHVIVAFVDLGFQVHPVQQVCGKVENDEPQGRIAGPDVLDSPHNPTSNL